MKNKRYFYPYLLLIVVLVFSIDTLSAQTQGFKELHKVKRKETIFGIARENGLTIEELIKANPEMNTPGYELKKGTYIKIPYPKPAESVAEPKGVEQVAIPAKPVVTKPDVRHREIRVGVVLPLHDDNGDGKRMVEYYRGMLMACDSLKANGISTDVRAWNLPEDGNVQQVLSDPYAKELDVIIGPLYTKQVKALADFSREHDIKLLIPFSINADVNDNDHVYRVFQNGYQLNAAFVERYMQRFRDAHPVIIDCNDTTSTKGGFTSALRRRLEGEGIAYSITNLRSSEGMFLKSFATNQRNVVILNTSRSAELNVAFAKLNGMLMSHPGIVISMYGYPEWLMYTRTHLEHFYKFDTFIPTTYYTNPLSKRAAYFRQQYRKNFRQDMQHYHARFAMTGFDQAYFFLKGMHLYGKSFTGASGVVGYTPLQTPLHFERVEGGLWQNRAMMLVHYTPENRIETINY